MSSDRRRSAAVRSNQRLSVEVVHLADTEIRGHGLPGPPAVFGQADALGPLGPQGCSLSDGPDASRRDAFFRPTDPVRGTEGPSLPRVHEEAASRPEAGAITDGDPARQFDQVPLDAVRARQKSQLLAHPDEAAGP